MGKVPEKVPEIAKILNVLQNSSRILLLKIFSLFLLDRDIKDENFSKLVLYRYSYMEKIENKAIQKY